MITFKIIVLLFFLGLGSICALNSLKGAISCAAKTLKIKNLLRASSQWSVASLKERGARSVALAAGGKAFLDSARALMSDDDIELATGIYLKPFVDTTKKNLELKLLLYDYLI